MRKPPFYKTVDTLFHGVMDRKWVQNNCKYFKDRPELSAALLGSAGTTAVFETGQHLTENFLPQFYNSGFKSLELLGVVGLTCVLARLGVYDKLENWSKEHPVYTAGMAAVASSAYVITLADLLLR